MKHKLIGLTEYAVRHLSGEDLEMLRDMIGCDIVESENRSEFDGGTMFVMPDGEETHSCFLITETI